MKKLPVILASISLLVVSIAPAFAEDTTTTATTTVAPTTSTTTTSLKQVVRPTLKAMRADAVDAMKDAISKARDDFKAKLETIKDEKKKTTVENIDTRIATVNKNRTDEMTLNLTKLSDIIDRISTKSTAAKAAGQNTTTVDSDVTSAKAAIALAQTAVTAQAAKVYTITITTDAALRPNVLTTLASFRKDIEAVYKKVVTARDGVRVAALDLEKLKSAAVTMTPAPTASEAATNQ